MRIVVVGDVLLDRDLVGSSTRDCPDAPAPVIDVRQSRRRAGGAGLVARLLALDGHETTLVTALSEDDDGRDLADCLDGLELVAGPSCTATPVKTRVLSSGTVVARLDQGCEPAPPPVVTADMLAALSRADAIVVSDYGRGLTADPALREALVARPAHVPLVWDPHPRGSEPVAGVSVVTPNLREALGSTGLSGDDRGTDPDLPTVALAARRLRERWRCEAVVVTLGVRGAWVQHGPVTGDGRQLPARPLAGVDSCGAGDRFASSLATALTAVRPVGGGRTAEHPDVDLARAVTTAIAVTGDFLSSGGVSAVPAPRAPRSAPLHVADARELVRRVHAAGGTMVATGGCFDLLHAGHLRMLRAASTQGDALVVCLNSDRSVRALKGPGRPLMNQAEREELLLALDCVDAVVVFDEDTPVRVLDELRPDIWVKGGDYVVELLPEYELVTGWGGRCTTVPFLPGHSTTSLVAALEHADRARSTHR